MPPSFGGTESEVVVDAEGGRPEHDDEQSGEDAEHHRDEHLDRGLLRTLFGELTALDPHLVGLRPKYAADRHAERVGLQDRQYERAYFWDVAPGIEGPHGIGAA